MKGIFNYLGIRLSQFFQRPKFDSSVVLRNIKKHFSDDPFEFKYQLNFTCHTVKFLNCFRKVRRMHLQFFRERTG